MVKFDTRQENEILKLHVQGISMSEIARKMEVSVSGVRKVIERNKGTIELAEKERTKSFLSFSRRQGEDDFDFKASMSKLMPKVIKRIGELIPKEDDLNKLKGLASLFLEMNRTRSIPLKEMDDRLYRSFLPAPHLHKSKHRPSCLRSFSVSEGAHIQHSASFSRVRRFISANPVIECASATQSSIPSHGLWWKVESNHFACWRFLPNKHLSLSTFLSRSIGTVPVA